jgi:hypothetical protein
VRSSKVTEPALRWKGGLTRLHAPSCHLLAEPIDGRERVVGVQRRAYQLLARDVREQRTRIEPADVFAIARVEPLDFQLTSEPERRRLVVCRQFDDAPRGERLAVPRAIFRHDERGRDETDEAIHGVTFTHEKPVLCAIL